MLNFLVAILITILPPCAEESDSYCFWDAQQSGNGNGHSFIAFSDSVIYI